MSYFIGIDASLRSVSIDGVIKPGRVALGGWRKTRDRCWLGCHGGDFAL